MRTKMVVALALGLAFGATTDASAQKLFVHGYASQAYGQTTDFNQLGVASDGTGDLRSVALQARLAFFSTGTQIVAQGAHRRVGTSPLATLLDDVELDWAFAEQRFLGNFSARVGRLPIPKGLVNERRDVGILLPFYQASNAFYTDGLQTVDGASMRYSRYFGDVEVEAQAYYGDIPIVISFADQNGMTAIDETGDDTWGGQIAISLPMEGFKVIGGMQDSDVWVGADDSFELDWESQWIGVEYEGERVFARAEQSWGYVPTYQDWESRYVQAGVHVGYDIWINGQREESTSIILDPAAAGYEYDPVADWAIGAMYKFRPDLVIKAEQHFTNGYAFDQVVNILGPALDNKYFILSVSAAF